MTSLNVDQARLAVRRWWFIPFCLGAMMVLIWGRAVGWPPPIVERDLHQQRTNQASLPPSGTLALSQTFTPQKNGFSALELRLVRHGDPQPEATGQIIFSIQDAQGALIAEERRQVGTLEHGDLMKLTFLPQANSAQTRYTLTISGIDNDQFGVSGFTLDTLDGGFTLTNGDFTTIQDLQFTTYYTLTPSEALRTLFGQLRDNVLLFSVTLLFLALPGALLFSFAPRLTSDNSTHVGIVLVLGAVLWPIVWLWTTVANFAWQPFALWAVFGVGWLIVIGKGIADKRRNDAAWVTSLPSQHTVALFIIVLLTFALRLLAVRDLHFPPWVDSVRHALITAVMTDSGQLLQNYAPYLDVGSPLYHFGFHTISASLMLMLDGDLPQTLLMIGQLFQAIIVLSIYSASYLFTRRRGVGLLAAFIVGLPMFFPAYYATWGRLTQLTGMLILAVLIGLTWRLTQETQSARKLHIVLVGLLAAGLFLVHFRVFLLYIPFALLAWLFGRMRPHLPIAGALALVVALPRIIAYVRITRPDQVLISSSTYNDFPTQYITAAWETELLIVTVACAVLALLHLSFEHQWLNWIIGLGFLGFTLGGEWLGFTPILFNIPFLRTGLVAGFFAFVLGGWQQPIGNWPLVLTLWLVFGHWLSTPQQHALALIGGAALVGVTPYLPARPVATATQSRFHWRTLIILNGLWVGLLFLLLLGRRIGLPESWVVNINSMIISLFLPYSIIIGLAVWAIWRWFQQQHWIPQSGIYVVMGGLVMYVLLFSVPHQINILAHVTILAETADRPALDWLDQNLPPDAHIAVSSWQWLGETWSGQDGGTWLVPLHNRSSTMPPADYNYNPDLFLSVNQFNEQARAVEDWSTDAAAQFLRENGVTHLYIGPRDGFLLPEQVAANPATELLYAANGAFIFALR